MSRRCCSVGQVRVWSISVTLLVLWCRLQAYLAARRWTISILLRCSAVWGSQTEHTYSRFGRERDRYAATLYLCWRFYGFFSRIQDFYLHWLQYCLYAVSILSRIEEWFQDILLKKLIPKYDCVASSYVLQDLYCPLLKKSTYTNCHYQIITTQYYISLTWLNVFLTENH